MSYNRILLMLTFCLGITTCFSQEIYNISDEGTHVFSCIGETTILTDSDVNGGNYAPDELYETTFCLGAGVEGTLEIIVSPDAFGNIWDVDADSYVMVYDGANSSAPLIGDFNTFNDPNGFIAISSGTCITVVFMSGSSSSGAGFTANVLCEEAFQPFNIDFVSEPAFVQTDISDYSITLCYTDSFQVSAVTDYPLGDASGNGYAQSDATTLFSWSMGDGVILSGLGLTDITYAYSGGSGHEILLTALDVQGTISYASFYVLQSVRPDFSNIALDDTLCIGASTIISGGINFSNQDTVGVDEGTGAILGGASVAGQETIVDADLSDCDFAYSLPIDITDFEDGQVLEDVNDIFNICMNVHHTYLGDLEAGIICPDGSTLILFDMMNTAGQCEGMFDGGTEGGGVNLGDPTTNPPTGFDYCWNTSPEYGTFPEEYTTPVNGSMPAGSYAPEGDFSELLGCPLNGEWQLIFKDSYLADVGVINSWSIFFNPNINPSTQYYSPTITDAGWLENDDLTVLDDSISVEVTPSQEGNNSFVFWAEDEFGCYHDTTINVYVRPMSSVDDAIACDLTHTLAPTNALFGTWTIISKPSPDAVVIGLNDPENGAVDNIQVSEYGIYEFLLTEQFCGYEATAVINFRPDPVVAPLVSDTTLCVGSSITLDAGPQAANSGNFNIVWTRDGQVINTSDYAIEADVTGQYIVTITGVCGMATDTTNLVAIDIDFTGSTVCGLQATGYVTLTPEGTGSWSTDSPDISFSTINQLNTQISSQNYGEYQITFTDDRCVNDGVSHPFRFVQPPVINVLPQNPDFCVDTDTLVITASIVGSNNGMFSWTENGAGTSFTNDTLVFPPTYFEPNVAYLFEAMAIDPYGVCPPGFGSTNFSGDWCEYHIPDVVTPNGDGMNDRFHVQYLELIPGSQIHIYDRWGKLVFESDNYGQYQGDNYSSNAPNSGGWDPSDMDTGTYYYELLLPSLDKTESGYIQVLEGEAKP